MKIKSRFFELLLTAFIGAIIALVLSNIFFSKNIKNIKNTLNTNQEHIESLHHLTKFNSDSSENIQSSTTYNYSNKLKELVAEKHFSSDNINFTVAAAITTPAVVFIKSISVTKSNSLFEIWYGYNAPESYATGSGVIISSDGYVVTNHHVIEDAKKIEILLPDNRKFTAKIVGKDPSTDLALLKIKSKTPLPFLNFGNSEKLKIGEWVLAVGNPYKLTSTVTAGIVSAKARSIDILKKKSADGYTVESFIQTDAAINPGNSGGALVNLKGELVGINTAIASLTGSYAGYAFAVPVSLVKKVTNDLKKYGSVQRAFLGVNIVEVTDSRVADNTKETTGVYILGSLDGGAAAEKGLRNGDIIKSIDGKKVDNIPEMEGIVGSKNPGNKVQVSYLRNKKIYITQLTLKNKKNNYSVIKEDSERRLGAVFKELSREDKYYSGSRFGVKIINIKDGTFKKAGIPTGFIITHIGREPVINIKRLNQLLDKHRVDVSKEGAVVVLGRYSNGEKDYFYLQW